MAYGARLESVLGESPRGFESPILRDCDEVRRSSRPTTVGAYPQKWPHLLPSHSRRRSSQPRAAMKIAGRFFHDSRTQLTEILRESKCDFCGTHPSTPSLVGGFVTRPMQNRVRSVGNHRACETIHQDQKQSPPFPARVLASDYPSTEGIIPHLDG